MEKSILARYDVTVYTDGTLKVVPVTENTSNLQSCSAIIRQIVGAVNLVLEHWQMNAKNNMHHLVVDAISQIATEERMSANTIHKKILKTLELNFAEFKILLEECLEQKAPDGNSFVEKLTNACQDTTKAEDLKAVEELIVKIRNS